MLILQLKSEASELNKKLMIVLALLAIISITAVPVFAMKAGGPSSVNGLSKGTNDHLYVNEKDPVTWEAVPDGPWGKLNINVKQSQFVFNGHGLTPEANYELICYIDPWPGTGSLSLGTAVADEEGNVHIKGEITVSELPIGKTPEDVSIGGSKIWLVLDTDFDGSQMVAWNPAEYLFEFDLLNTEA